MALCTDQFATYGKTFEGNFMGTSLINTMHSENIQQIATSLSDNFIRNTGRKNTAWPFMGKSIITTDKAEWKHYRNLVNPTFARPELLDIEGLSVFVDRLIDLIPRDGKSFDIQALHHKMVRSWDLVMVQVGFANRLVS